MVTSLYSSFVFSGEDRRKCVFLLALSWIAGLLAGSFVAIGGGNSFQMWMRAAQLGSVSILGLSICLYLPFLLSAFAVFLHFNWLVYPVAFFKVFSFGFCAAGTMMVYHSAGWLVCSLLLFSDFCVLPLLFWFMTRRIAGKNGTWTLELMGCAALVFLVGTVDRCIVSPFLAMLIEL